VSRLFDAYLMVDWSARSVPAPRRPVADAIWLCWQATGERQRLEYFRTRADAEGRIAGLLSLPGRILAGFDFGLALAAWVHRELGRDWLAFWNYLDESIVDTPSRNNRFEVAEELNRRLSGGPFPFWATPRASALLPARRTAEYTQLRPEFRIAESYLRQFGARPQSSFKLYTTGAVGSQILLGLPMLARLKRRFADDLCVWPYEPMNRRIVIAEVYPSLFDFEKLAPVRRRIKDARQVTGTVRLMSRTGELGLLSALFELPPEAELAQEEGWVFGGNPALGEVQRRVLALH